LIRATFWVCGTVPITLIAMELATEFKRKVWVWPAIGVAALWLLLALILLSASVVSVWRQRWVFDSTKHRPAAKADRGLK
jgi:hypothetical protein